MATMICLSPNIVTANTGDPIWFLANYWHTNVDGSNPQNGSGYSNPQVDQLLDAAETEFDPANVVTMQFKFNNY